MFWKVFSISVEKTIKPLISVGLKITKVITINKKNKLTRNV